MRAMGVRGIARGRAWQITTQSAPIGTRPTDLVERRFTAMRPNQLWVADFLIAVWLVRSLPLDIVRWGVIVVVLYTAVTLIRSAVEERRTLAAARAGVPVGL